MNAETNQREKRSSIRYIVRFPLIIQRDGESHSQYFESDNVSSGGIFVRSHSPFKPGERLHIQFDLPLGIGTICFAARVQHVAHSVDEAGTIAGFGLIWDPPDQNSLERWLEFVDELQKLFEAEKNTKPPSKSANYAKSDSANRFHQRYISRLKVRFKTVDELATLTTSDVSAGGMFLETDNPFSVGQLIEIEVVHPETGHVFALKAAVRWRGEKAGRSGIGIQLLDMVGEKAHLFESFVTRHLAASNNLV